MPKVDPFIPLNTPNKQSMARPTQTHSSLYRKPRAIDEVSRIRPGAQRIPVNRVGSSQPRAPDRHVNGARRSSDEVSRPTKKDVPLHKRIGGRLQSFGVIMVATSIGLAIQSQLIGICAIAIYAVFVFLRRIDSQTTFLLALLSFLSIAIILLVRSDTTAATHFALYAFLLLTLGTITLAREVHEDQS